MAIAELEKPRYVTLLGAVGQIRAAKFQKRDHLVVPVIALVEGVLHPANTDRPEFVPAEVIGHAPQGWNGRPVVVGHPQVGEEFVSANSPEILEAESVGLIFNSEFRDNKLQLEAWIDKEKVGQNNPKTLEKLEANQMMEVSVGALVSTELKRGNHKGKDFFAVWRNMVPDHLAFLRDGDTGACSNAAGCGAPRVAQEHEEPMADDKIEEQPKKTLRERLFDLMTFKSNKSEEDMSDRDLRAALERALGGEAGFIGIDSVFPSDSRVIYAVASQEKITLFSREYSFTNGEIKLAKKAEEVHPVTRFESVTAQSPSCGCAAGGKVMDKAQRIKGLIDSGRFLEADRTWLEQVPEDRLSQLETQPKKEEPKQEATPVAAQAPKPDEKKADAKPLTAEEYINAAPAEMQETLREGLRVQQERRTAIIAALKDTKRCDFTDEQLAIMSTDQLAKLSKLAEVPEQPTFMGRVNARPREESKGVPPAPSLVDRIKAARSKTA